MKIFEKIGRIFTFTTEMRLKAMVAKHERDQQKIFKKAEKVIEDFKKEVDNDPAIKAFRDEYKRKYESTSARLS